MFQNHLIEALTTPVKCAAPTNDGRDVDLNAMAWLLMGDARLLLQLNVDEAETAKWLTATLAKLLPTLKRIHENQFESGRLCDLLHSSPVDSDAAARRSSDFQVLLDTLDELQIRLEWNLPVAELVPFADLRLAYWMSEIRVRSDI